MIQDGEYIHIIMEQCKGGDLFDITVDKKLSERRVRKIVGSLLGAMVYLHDRDIVHRDLKVSSMGEGIGCGVSFSFCMQSSTQNTCSHLVPNFFMGGCLIGGTYNVLK